MDNFYLNTKRLCFLLLVFISSAVYAQERVITGKVIEAGTNEALPGVAIQVVGTSNGAITVL